MKKQKLIKQQAYVSEPALENSFTVPATHDGQMSIVFGGKDISIHGYDGSVWTTLHTWDGTADQFTADNWVHNYTNFYLKSLTGSSETIRVSLFSAEKYQGSTPSIVGVDRGIKLYDIDEVPIYTASDVNKMLTIMSNGSLRWLLASESYIIPTEGGEAASNMVGLEENLNITLHGNAQLANGVLSFDGTSGTYASLPHSTDYDRESGDLTIYMWMKPNSLPSNWNAALVSKMGAGWSGYIAAISTMAADAGGNMTTGGLQTTTFGGGNSNNRAAPSGGIALNTWHHVAFVMPAVGDYKMYFNGQEVHSYSPTNRITGTSGDLKIGGWENGGYSGYFDGDIDGLFIQKSAMVASDISDLHSAGRGSQPSFLEDLARFNFPTGIVTDNHSGMGHGLTLNLDGDDIISYDGNGQPVEEEFTISWWMNLNTTQDAGTVSVLGRYDPPADRFALKVGGNINGNAHITTQIGSQTMFNTNSGMAVAGGWVHAAYTCKSNGSNLVVSLYINGTKLPGTKGYPLGTKLLPSSSNESFGFGYSGASGKSVKGQFDSIQIEEGIALTDAQVAAIAAQADRQMGVEAASQL